MAVALSEPQAPISFESATQRGGIKQARERVKFKTNFQTEEQRAQFVDDFHLIASSSESTTRDKETFVKVFKSQDKASKLYIGQILLEQLEDQVRNTKDEKSIRAFLQVAKLIHLSKECSLDKQEKKDIDGLLAELNKVYAQQTTAHLSLGQRVILGAGAAGVLLVAGDPVARQAAREIASSVPPIAGLPDANRGPDFTPVLPDTQPNLEPTVTFPIPDENPPPVLVLPAPAINLPFIGPILPEPKGEKLQSDARVELVPNQIRVLQNPELNKLYREGCIDFKEIDVGNKKVMVLDYMPKPGISCNIKFPQAYTAAPIEGRVRTYQQVDSKDLGITLEQFNATCAIYSFVIASMMVTKETNGQTPIVVNPLLLGEADSQFTQEIFKQFQQEVINDPALNRQYDANLLRIFGETTPINRRFLLPDLAEKVFKSVFGVTLKRSNEMRYPTMSQDKKNASLEKSMFSEAEWQQLGTQYKLSFNEDGTSVAASSQETGKIYGKWLENWFKQLKTDADKQNKVATATLNLSFYSSGVNHMYTIVGYEEKDGKGYFRTTEGLQGYISPYLQERGARKNSDETVSIPVDKLLEIGLNDAFVVSADKKPAQLQNAERKERVTSDQIGFRVNEVESIKNLPAGTGVIRIAGNETIVDDKGNIIDKEYDVEGMLKAAKEKGLKVVFVYNPVWFPDQEGKPRTVEQVKKDEAKIRASIRQQLSAVLKYDNVWSVEIGNEPTENNPTDPHQFWQGNFDSYLLNLKWTAEEADKIVKAQKTTNPNRPETRLIAAALSFPEKHDKEYRQMAATLNELSNRIGLPLDVAIHAYDIKTLRWMIQNLPSIFGKERKFVLSETGMELVMRGPGGGLVERPGALQELEEMLSLAQQKGILTLVHEYKFNPALAAQAEYTGGYYGLTDGDPRLNLVQGRLDRRVAELNGGNQPVAGGIVVPGDVYNNLQTSSVSQGGPPVQVFESARRT